MRVNISSLELTTDLLSRYNLPANLIVGFAIALAEPRSNGEVLSCLIFRKTRVQ